MKFWYDIQCNDISLKDSFHSLFTFAVAKEVQVDDVQEV